MLESLLSNPMEKTFTTLRLKKAHAIEFRIDNPTNDAIDAVTKFVGFSNSHSITEESAEICFYADSINDQVIVDEFRNQLISVGYVQLTY